MNGAQLISKGITTEEGLFAVNLEMDNIASYVYANKAGFVQGKHSVVIQPNSYHDLKLKNFTVINEAGTNIASFGARSGLVWI